MDASGQVLVCGRTGSTFFPTSMGTIQDQFGGGIDMFLQRLALPFTRPDFTATPPRGPASLKVELDAGATSSFPDTTWSAEWDFGDGSPAQTGEALTHEFTRPARYAVTLTVTNSAGLVSTLQRDVTATPLTVASEGWTGYDIGNPAFPGGARPLATPGGFEICAGGKDLSGREDQLYLYGFEAAGRLPQAEAPDRFALTARFDDIADYPRNSRVGLMIREGPSADSAHFSVVISHYSTSLRVETRTRRVAGGSTQTERPREALDPVATWLRLERCGETIRSSLSLVGTSWTPLLEERDFTLSADLLAGLCAVRNDPGRGAFDPVCARITDFELAPSPCSTSFLRGDGNDDGMVDISDPVFNLEHQFLGKPGPPAPYPGCGPESLRAEEALPCERAPESCP